MFSTKKMVVIAFCGMLLFAVPVSAETAAENEPEKVSQSVLTFEGSFDGPIVVTDTSGNSELLTVRDIAVIRDSGTPVHPKQSMKPARKKVTWSDFDDELKARPNRDPKRLYRNETISNPPKARNKK